MEHHLPHCQPIVLEDDVDHVPPVQEVFLPVTAGGAIESEKDKDTKDESGSLRRSSRKRTCTMKTPTRPAPCSKANHDESSDMSPMFGGGVEDNIPFDECAKDVENHNSAKREEFIHKEEWEGNAEESSFHMDWFDEDASSESLPDNREDQLNEEPFKPVPRDPQQDLFYLTLEQNSLDAIANPPLQQNGLAQHPPHDPFLGVEHTFPSDHHFYHTGTRYPPNIISMLRIIDYCDNRKQNSRQFVDELIKLIAFEIGNRGFDPATAPRRKTVLKKVKDAYKDNNLQPFVRKMKLNGAPPEQHRRD